MSKSLIELDRECRLIVEQIEAAGGELTEESETALNNICSALVEKADNYAYVMDRLEFGASLWKSRKTECANAERVLQTAHERLKDRMKYVLTAHPDKSLQGETVRFFLTKGRDTLILDEEAVPREFKTAKIELVVDRDKVEAALKAGAKVPGAILKTENYSLRQGRPK